MSVKDINVTEVTNYKVMLDAHPGERWINIIELYREQILMVLEQFEKLIDSKIISRKILEWSISFNSSLWTFPYYEELMSLAKVLNISFARAWLLQGYYELFQSSTTILMNKPRGITNDLDFEKASMCSNPPMAHIHLMESPLSILLKMVIKVKFYLKGRIIYRATTYPGYLGIMLGSRSLLGSIVYSNRYLTRNHYANIKRLVWGYMPTGFLIRQVLEDPTIKSYSVLCGRLRISGTMAPAYISITGDKNNEGTIMYRNPELTHEREFPQYNQVELDNKNLDSKYVPALVLVNIDTPYIRHMEVKCDEHENKLYSYLWSNLPNMNYNNERYDMTLYKSYDLYDIMSNEHLSDALGSDYFTKCIKKYLEFPILNDKTTSVTWMESGRNVHYTIAIQ